jgi:integration host factor subunit beta
MLKSDLVNILIQKRGVTQKQAEATIETIFDAMKDALCRGENIEIRGLGAFHVKSYDGYQGRNPKTGQIIPVKPKRGLLFRTGKELRDRVNRPPAQEATNALVNTVIADGLGGAPAAPHSTSLVGSGNLAPVATAGGHSGDRSDTGSSV